MSEVWDGEHWDGEGSSRDPEALAEERAWQRRAELAEERRQGAELDERLDHLPFTLREASRAVDDVLARLLELEGFAELSLGSVRPGGWSTPG